jgi:predicted transport protein
MFFKNKINKNQNPCTMKKTMPKKTTKTAKVKVVAEKKNSKSAKPENPKTQEKLDYPLWTMPRHLSDQDHKDLKRFYELFISGKIISAFSLASNFDTIVREAIPPEIWKQSGGNLSPEGEAKLNETTETKEIAPPEPLSPQKEESAIKEEKTQQKPSKMATAADFSAFIVKDDTLQVFPTERFNVDPEKQPSPVENNFQTEQEFEQLIIANNKLFFGQSILITTNKKDDYFPDKFLIDFHEVDKPKLYIIETVLGAQNFGFFYAQITHFFALFKNQNTMSDFHEKLCEIVEKNQEQKEELQSMIGENKDIPEFLSALIEKKPAILLIMDNDRKDLPLLMDTYTDTWGKLTKSIVIKTYTDNGNIIYTMRPDFSDIWKNEKTKVEIIKNTEEDHLNAVTENIRNIYKSIKTSLLEADSTLEFNPKKHYISIRKNKNLAFLQLKRKLVDIVVMNPEADTRTSITKHRIKSLPSSVQKFWNGECCTIVVENSENLEEIIDLLKKVISKV